jgi:hypothetical protein
MMVAPRSPLKSVLTRATWRNIPEYDILHSHRRENLKFRIEFAPISRRQWLTETMQNFDQGKRCPSRDMDRETTEYYAEWLMPEPP